jgi:hypothetical protein
MLLMRRVLLLALALPSGAVAQEKIRIRALPSSDLTVRMSVDQTMHFDVVSAALPAPVSLDGSVTMRFTQRTGRPDSAGVIDAQLTYD